MKVQLEGHFFFFAKTEGVRGSDFVDNIVGIGVGEIMMNWVVCMRYCKKWAHGHVVTNKNIIKVRRSGL
jgi:hypothetical protein